MAGPLGKIALLGEEDALEAATQIITSKQLGQPFKRVAVVRGPVVIAQRDVETRYIFLVVRIYNTSRIIVEYKDPLLKLWIVVLAKIAQGMSGFATTLVVVAGTIHLL